METAVPMTVLMKDPGCVGAVRPADSLRVLRSGAPSAVAHAHNIFVCALASDLAAVTPFVRAA